MSQPNNPDNPHNPSNPDSPEEESTGAGERVQLALSARQRRRLDDLLALSNYRDRQALLQEAAEHFLSFLEEDFAKTDAAIAEVEAGHVASDSEVEETYARIREKARAASRQAERDNT